MNNKLRTREEIEDKIRELKYDWSQGKYSTNTLEELIDVLRWVLNE